MDDNIVFSVGDLIDTNDIPIYVKNDENELIINISVYDFDADREDGLVHDYDGFGLSGFDVNGQFIEIKDMEKGSPLQEFFPVLYRGVQNAVMAAVYELGLY